MIIPFGNSLILSGAGAIGLLAFLLHRREHNHPLERLISIFETEYDLEVDTVAEKTIDDEGEFVDIKKLSTRLGRAGFLTRREKKRARLTLVAINLAIIAPVGIYFGPLALVPALYLAVMVSLFFLRFKANSFRREVLFQLPLTLESLILLVESGLGVLPAIEHLVTTAKSQGGINPILRLLDSAYRIAEGGLPFSDALRLVAEAIDDRAVKHVLLHLDMSGSEGSELVPAIRSLSNHTHSEWKLGVESRVRKLESLVIFPVFFAVMGLLAFAASVPLIPILELGDKMEDRDKVISKAPAMMEVNRR